MKKVFIFMTSLLIWQAEAKQPGVIDSMKIAKDISLDEVVVTATKADKNTPVAYSELSGKELTKRNDGRGIPALISQSPSVITTSDDGLGIGYSGFRIRGTDANRINITLNGVPLNDAESHGVFWVNMPDIASSVSNIQIQRGAGTSTNGAASFGATVAMQTEKPSMKPYAEYSVSAGSFGTVKNTVKGGTGLLYDHFVFDGRYSDIRSDGFIDRASTHMGSYFFSAAWYGKNTLLKFQTFGSNEKTYQAWNGVSLEDLRAGNRTYNSCGEYKDEEGNTKFYNNQTDNYKQQHYHLMASQRLGDFWNMSLTLHYTPGEGYYEDYKKKASFKNYKLPEFYLGAKGDTIKTSDLVRRKWLESDFGGFVYSANYRNKNLAVTLGAAGNRYVCDHFGRVIWIKSIDKMPDPDYEYYRNTGKKNDYNVYVKANYQFLPYLGAYVDLQYRGIDYSIKGSDDKAGEGLDVKRNWDFFNPKAGINLNKDGHHAFVSFSMAHREPNRDNFTEAGINERPTYETLRDYEAGYSFGNDCFNLGANLYFMDYDNQLILTGRISDIGEPLTSNIKDSYRMGIELTGGVRITSWLSWNGNATFSRNRIRNFTEYVVNYDTEVTEARNLGSTDIAYSPDIVANSMFDFVYKGLSASLNTQFVGSQYLNNTSDKELSIDRYCVSSLRVGYVFKPRFIKEIGLDVTVNNLFNTEYETNGFGDSSISEGKREYWSSYFTQAGTNAMARLTLKF